MWSSKYFFMIFGAFHSELSPPNGFYSFLSLFFWMWFWWLRLAMNAFSMKSAHSEGCHNCPYLDKFCTAATSKDQAKWILTTFYFYVAQLTIHRKILKIHRAGRRYCQSERESLVDVVQMLSTKLWEKRNTISAGNTQIRTREGFTKI